MRSLDPGLGHLPSPFEATAMPFVRFCEPGLAVDLHLQDFVHGDQPLQSPRTQSTSQLPVLHNRSSPLAGHSLPPYSASVMTALERPCWPPPQSLLHLDQPDQSDITQS